MNSKKNASPNLCQEKCAKCGKLPTDKKPQINCDSCKILLCGECHGLSPTEVRVLELKTVARVMTFLCGDCKSAMSQLPMIMRKLNELTEEVHHLRLRQSMLATESVIQEMNERANRANNIIIYDVPESDSDVIEERKEHDMKECAAIVENVTKKVRLGGVKLFRLGAPNKKASTQPRPLKVVLHSKTDALEILRNRTKLRKPTSITADLTPMQREHMKYLREELNKRINEGEMDITIKYVRGHPMIIKTKIQKN